MAKGRRPNRWIALIAFVAIMCAGALARTEAATGPALQAAVVSPALVGAPILNNNQPLQTSGPTLTLSWSAPAGGVPLSYNVEASSAPGGPANLANFNTGNAVTLLTAPNVPAG